MFLDEIHVTFYADTAAAILSLGVLVLCSRGVIKDIFLSRLFSLLLAVTFFLAIVDAGTYAWKYKEFSGAVLLAMGFRTLHEIILDLIIVLWLLFVNYKVYHSRDGIKRKFAKYLIPLFVLMVLDIINIFTGIRFYYDDQVVFHTTMFTVPYNLVRYFYLLACIIQIGVHKSRGNDLKFFDLGGFIVPIVVAGLVSNLTPYSCITLGIAIGLCNVYAGIINEQSFLDRQTGFFNRYYLRYLKSDIRRKVFYPKSGMIYRLEDPEDMQAFSGLLSPILPKKCEVVSYAEDTVIMLAEISKKSALHVMTEDVNIAVEGYNENHPDKPMTVTIDTVFKKNKETEKGFYDMFIRRIG